MALTITALTAAITAIMLLATAIDTVRQRWPTKAAFGDAGGDQRLVAAIRSHANLAEHGPLAVIMIGLLEAMRAENLALKIVAGLFLAVRAAHIVGLHQPVEGKPPLLRSIGVAGTWLVYAVLILWLLATVIRINGLG